MFDRVLNMPLYYEIFFDTQAGRSYFEKVYRNKYKVILVTKSSTRSMQ